MMSSRSPMNVLPELELDIIIDEAPEVATVQQRTSNPHSLGRDARIPIPPQALIEASGLSSATKKKVLDAMSGHLPDGTEIPPQVQQQIQQAQQQIQQITEAQQAKTQEQQVTEQQLTQIEVGCAVATDQSSGSHGQGDGLSSVLRSAVWRPPAGAGRADDDHQGADHHPERKEIELKACSCWPIRSWHRPRKRRMQWSRGASKEAAITVLTTKLETQQHQHAAVVAQHQKQMAELGTQHNQALHGEREKARTAQETKPIEKPKVRKVTVERDSSGRISGATVQ